MTTFVALTSIDGNDFFALCYGNDKEAVASRARELCGNSHPTTLVTHGGNDYYYTGSDIYAQTKHVNMRVVTKTAARKFGVDIDAVPDYFDEDYEPLEEVK